VIERVIGKGEARQRAEEARAAGRSIGLVPTMGALHAGHLSLVRAAKQDCELVVVSVFVNPTQFGPGEDFERYPRDIERDAELLSAEGADIVFTPTAEDMFGDGPVVTVDPGALARHWEGEIRPGHFSGVATVVAKLFGVIRPHVAFFGEKDFQQLVVVKRLATDLDTGVRVVGMPTVRETDGLALSSRNAYLSPDERERALGLSAALEAVAQAVAWGEADARVLEGAMRLAATDAGLETLDYAAVVDPVTLEPLDRVEGPARALIAGRVGATRLIDNCALDLPAEEVSR